MVDQPRPIGPMRDNVGTCLQATKVSEVASDSVTYKDVAGKKVIIPLSASEAQVLREKHGGSIG